MQAAPTTNRACRHRPETGTRRSFTGTTRRRAGVVILEVIVLFPVIVILLAAVIEFGLLLSGIKHVQAAGRAGAKIASELTTSNLTAAPTTNNVDVVQTTVDRVLSSAGFTSCEVILEYIVPTPMCTGVTSGSGTQTAGSCTGCNAPSASLPALADVPGGSVRVTVCVDADQLTPDLLSTFGFDVSSKVITTSTTLPYENCPDAP